MCKVAAGGGGPHAHARASTRVNLLLLLLTAGGSKTWTTRSQRCVPRACRCPAWSATWAMRSSARRSSTARCRWAGATLQCGGAAAARLHAATQPRAPSCLRPQRHAPPRTRPHLQLYGRLDVLVSNAAVNPTAGPLLETPADAIDKILDINIKAALLLVQAAAPHMRLGGRIVLISSVTAFECVAVPLGTSCSAAAAARQVQQRFGS